MQNTLCTNIEYRIEYNVHFGPVIIVYIYDIIYMVVCVYMCINNIIYFSFYFVSFVDYYLLLCACLCVFIVIMYVFYSPIMINILLLARDMTTTIINLSMLCSLAFLGVYTIYMCITLSLYNPQPESGHEHIFLRFAKFFAMYLLSYGASARVYIK